MITLRQLRYLSALAKYGHFGRAAEACAVTQPALSMQIRDLERTLGVAVVERRPGDVMLTDVGREIAGGLRTCSRPRAIWSTSRVIAAACSPAG
jgi:LysR family transcriptional regulator, hydrogen peroxide-inducible genes activator